jgi:hypothetical protein
MVLLAARRGFDTFTRRARKQRPRSPGLGSLGSGCGGFIYPPFFSHKALRGAFGVAWRGIGPAFWHGLV